jgi:uncharacterized iron-regulated protein
LYHIKKKKNAQKIRENVQVDKKKLLTYYMNGPIAGYFHVKQNLGIPEHLAHYCTAIDYGQTTIVMLPEEDLVFTESEHRDAADLVVLTDINAIDL